jgi:hypothetical protein
VLRHPGADLACYPPHEKEQSREGEGEGMCAPRSGTTLTTSPRAKTSNQSGTAPAAVRSCRVRSSTTSRTEVESYGLASRPPLAERSVIAGKVTSLEGRLFDGEGHLRHGLSHEKADTLLSEINDLRLALGWLSLDLHHQQIWPVHLGS